MSNYLPFFGSSYFMAIPHNSKCRYGERGTADAVPQPPKRCLSRKAGIVRYCLMLFFVLANAQPAMYWPSKSNTVFQ